MREMNRDKKRNLQTILVALGLSAALLLGILTGCDVKNPLKKDETTERPPAESTGLTLHLYQPHPGQAALWEELGTDYRNLTGVNVVVRSSKNAAATELKEALKGETDAPGLFMFANPREYKNWQDHALALTDTEAFGHLIDAELALNAEGKPIGLPLGVEAFGLIYNKKVLGDYFALSDKATAFAGTEDIKTYKDLEDLAKDLDANKQALGLTGVFAAPALKEGESTAWGTRLLSVPLGYEIAQKNVDVTGDDANEIQLRHETGLKSFTDLHLNYSTTKESLENRTYAGAAQEFAEGKAAFILGSTDFLGLLNSAVGQSVSGTDTAFLPALMQMDDVERQGLAFEPTLYAAINARAGEEEKKAAAEFLNWLVTSERGLDFLAGKLGLIAPFESVTDESLPQNPLCANAFAWLKNGDVENAVTYSALTPTGEFRDDVVGAGLLSYSKGESDWEKFKTDIKDGWKNFRAKADDAL